MRMPFVHSFKSTYPGRPCRHLPELTWPSATIYRFGIWHSNGFVSAQNYFEKSNEPRGSTADHFIHFDDREGLKASLWITYLIGGRNEQLRCYVARKCSLGL